MDGAATVAHGETLTFSQKIKSGDFVGLSFKNFLLNMVTLSLYRFWAKTEVRRRIWDKVSLNGEPFEYTGTGKELFFGFLKAMVVIFVPYLTVLLATQFVSKWFMILFLPMYIALFVLLGAAIFMAFRYVAGRTTWRGVRFRVKGSASDYGWAYLGYGLLTSITFGWFAPAMTMRLEGKLWSSLSFGDKKLTWQREANENLYGPFALAWIVGIVGYGVFIALLMPSFMGGLRPNGVPDVALFFKIYGYALVYALVVTVASAAYHAAVMRAVVAAIRIDDARFSTSVKALDLIVLSLTNALIVVFSLGILTPVVAARTVRFVISRLSSTGTVNLAEVLQAPRSAGGDEGLADAFDLSPF
uniref:DUF898 domain-containing protein n=1 Tax=Caulobacter sp. (strain K31) TaxID=366602 RepID=B0T500_CAUSK